MTRRSGRPTPRLHATAEAKSPPPEFATGVSALEALACAALCIIWTWPLAQRVTTSIPLGSEPVATVPLLNLWTLWWNTDRIGRLYAGYWDAPIFHPASYAFALSEPQPLAGAFAAACKAAGLPLLAAYNLFLLLSLTLNGWASARLLRAAGLDGLAAMAGAAMVTTLPFVHQELGVLQLVPVFGILWALHALWRLHLEPSLSGGARLGGAFVVAGLLCAYYGLFLGALLVPAAALLVPRSGVRGRFGRALLAAVLLAGTLLAPLAAAMSRAATVHGLRRSEESRLKHSARLADYVRTPWPALVPAPGIRAADAGAKAFFPGVVKALLALAGLTLGLRAPTARRFAALCGSLLVVALVLSLGPEGRLIGLIPGHDHIRSAFRFAVFAQLMLVLLAALGLAAIGQRFERRSIRAASLVGLAALAVAELRPGPTPLQPLPPLDARAAWLEDIETRTARGDVLAFLPFPAGRSVTEYLGTSQWMYWQMRHGRRMVNGYSGFFPESFLQLKAAMKGFPDPRSIEALAERGVTWVVVPTFVASRQVMQAAPPERHRLRWSFGDAANGIDVYALESVAP